MAEHKEIVKPRQAGEVSTCWVEVDLAAIAHNLRAVRALVGEGVRIAAVVKANAYGHGIVQTSLALAEAGADFLGVTTLEEGCALRKVGIRLPILILGSLLPSQAGDAVRHGLTPSLSDPGLARAVADAAVRQGRRVPIHIKVDTGMGRFGVLPGDLLAFARYLDGLPGLQIEGIYTHFPTALEKDKSGARRQFRLFRAAVEDLQRHGFAIPIKHAAASAALVDLPETRLDMVRPGTLLYGQYPSRWVSRVLDLAPTWQLKTRICLVKKIPKGWTVGYGSEWRAPRPTRIAVLPVGFASGLSVEPSSTASGLRGLKRLLRRKPHQVTIRGQRAPIVGRIAMQSCCVDITELPEEIAPGEEVVLPARRVLVPPDIPRLYRP